MSYVVQFSGKQKKYAALAITHAAAIKQIIIDGYADMSKKKNRSQLICSFYNALTDFKKTDNMDFDLTSCLSDDSSYIDSPSHTQTANVPTTQATPVPNHITPLKRPKPGTPESISPGDKAPMDTDHLPHDLTNDMLKLTFVQVELLDRNDLLPYLVFFAKKYKREFRQGYFHQSSTREFREHLIVALMELHSHYTPSMLTEHTTKEHIECLEPLRAYNEYFLMTSDGEFSFNDILLLPINHVKEELIKQKILAPKKLEESFSDPLITQPAAKHQSNKLHPNEQNPSKHSIDTMIKSKYNNIVQMQTHNIVQYLKLFSKYYDRKYFDEFEATGLSEQRDVLMYSVVELHTLHTKPSLHQHVSDLDIRAWDRVKVLFEYHMFYHSSDKFDSLVFHDMPVEKIRDDIIVARDSMLLQDENESQQIMEQNNDNENITTKANDIKDLAMHGPEQDAHMFYIGEVLTCDAQQEVELMFFKQT